MTEPKRYLVHDFVKVIVDSDVDEGIQNQIDFQLGYFRTSSNRDVQWEIHLSPYEPPKGGPTEVNYYRETGIRGEYWHVPSEEIVVHRNNRGFHISTNNPSVNINSFLHVLLLRSGVSLVHAAGVKRGDEITLLPGAGGVGKTALVGTLVNQEAYKTLGDDVICVGRDGTCHSFPREFVLKEYHREVYPETFERHGLNDRVRLNDIRSSVVDFILANAPFLGITKRILKKFDMYRSVASKVSQISGNPYIATLPLSDLFGAESVAEKGDLSRVVFLERHNGKEFRLDPIDAEQLGRRMFATLLTEWKFSAPRLFSMGALDIVDLPSYYETTFDTIQKGINDVPCFVLSIPTDATPAEVHRFFVQSFHS